MNASRHKAIIGSLFNAIAATAAMSVVSMLANQKSDKDLLVPNVFGELLKQDLPPLYKRYARLLGWAGHCALGISWAMMIGYLYQKTPVKPTLRNGALLGILSGLCGMAAWELLFQKHAIPPGTNVKTFHKQLFIAHMVYILTYTELEGKRFGY